MEKIYVGKGLNLVFEKHAKYADAVSPSGRPCANESFNLVNIKGTQNAAFFKIREPRLS